jgi:hypothetical protein
MENSSTLTTPLTSSTTESSATPQKSTPQAAAPPARNRWATPEAKAQRAERRARPPSQRRKYLVKWTNPTVHDAYWFLKPRERKFVDNLLSGMSYRDAFKAAGFDPKGDGGNYIKVMRKPVVRAAIYQKVKEHEAQGDISTSQWLRELSTLAFMPSDMLSGPPTWRDKLKALELLGRYQKWLTDNKHVRIDIGIGRLFGAATQAIISEAAKAATPQIVDASGDAMVNNLAGAVLEHAPTQGQS